MTPGPQSSASSGGKSKPDAKAAAAESKPADATPADAPQGGTPASAPAPVPPAAPPAGEAKPAEKAKSAEKSEPPARVYTRDELRQVARPLLGVSPHALAGMLEGVEAETLTLAEAKAEMAKFLKRPAEPTDDEAADDEATDEGETV